MIVAEVRLLHRAVLDGELLRQRAAQPVDYRAFDLRQRILGLDDEARIGRDPIVVDLDLAGRAIDGNLRDPGRERVVIVRKCEPEPAARPLAFPVCHLGHRLDHRARTRMIFGKLEPHRERIDTAHGRDLVNE